jgi:hypothetical protein
MSHQHINPIAPRDLVKQLRTLVPLRPLTLSESYTLAERQASQALDLAGLTEPGLTLRWLLDPPRVEVRLAPRHRMDRLSGMTTFSHGRYLILINQNDVHARRRFTQPRRTSTLGMSKQAGKWSATSAIARLEGDEVEQPSASARAWHRPRH